MVKCYMPANEGELLVVRSRLDEAGIRYYVQNENFGNMYVSLAGTSTQKAVFVAERDLGRARDIISAILPKEHTRILGTEIETGKSRRRQKHAVGRTLMLILALFFLVPFVFVAINAIKSLIQR